MGTSKVRLQYPVLKGASYNPLEGMVEKNEHLSIEAQHLIVACTLSGASNRDISRHIFNGAVSPATVSRVWTRTVDRMRPYLERSLAGMSFPVILFDFRHLKCKVRGTDGERVVDRHLLRILGINAGNGRLEPLHLSVHPVEDAETFRLGLQDLVDRGLEKSPVAVVGDLANSIPAAVREVFPGAMVFGCSFHAVQAAYSKLPRNGADDVKEQISAVYAAPREEREAELAELERILGGRYPAALNSVRANLETATFADDFLAFSAVLAALFRTNNISERVNEEDRRREKVMGYFQSVASMLRYSLSVSVAFMEKMDSFATPGQLALARGAGEDLQASLREAVADAAGKLVLPPPETAASPVLWVDQLGEEVLVDGHKVYMGTLASA